MPDTRKPRRTKVGRVTSNKMDKTVVVAVELVTRHKLYGRTLRRSRSFKAHDETNRCQIGDTVVIAESRPISKDKYWRVTDILRRGTGEPVAIEEVPSLEPEPEPEQEAAPASASASTDEE
jgi:small subunit ribosomal protein S17